MYRYTEKLFLIYPSHVHYLYTLFPRAALAASSPLWWLNYCWASSNKVRAVVPSIGWPVRRQHRTADFTMMDHPALSLSLSLSLSLTSVPFVLCLSLSMPTCQGPGLKVYMFVCCWTYWAIVFHAICILWRWTLTKLAYNEYLCVGSIFLTCAYYRGQHLRVKSNFLFISHSFIYFYLFFT